MSVEEICRYCQKRFVRISQHVCKSKYDYERLLGELYLKTEKKYNQEKEKRQEEKRQEEKQRINDSIIQIANAKIFVSDITVLKYTNWKNRIKRFTGFTTIGFGTGIVLVGVADYILTKIVNIFNFNISYTRPIALMSSGSMTIVSGILILKSKKSFKSSSSKN